MKNSTRGASNTNFISLTTTHPPPITQSNSIDVSRPSTRATQNHPRPLTRRALVRVPTRESQDAVVVALPLTHAYRRRPSPRRVAKRARFAPGRRARGAGFRFASRTEREGGGAERGDGSSDGYELGEFVRIATGGIQRRRVEPYRRSTRR